MRPSDLKYPFIGQKEKKVFFQDHVLFVPGKGVADYNAYTFPGWSALFNNTNPVMVEYCSGNGAWIAAKAQEFPEKNWVAVEKKFDRVKKIWAKINNHSLSNLIVVHGEALFVTNNYFPKNEIAGIYINFPDPWPKRRHARFRLIQPTFIQQLYGQLKEGCEVTVATDDEAYSNSLIKDFNASGTFKSHFFDPYYINEYPGYGTSYFEDLWREQGLSIRYHRFVKQGAA